jgi:hypothetical protein
MPSNQSATSRQHANTYAFQQTRHGAIFETPHHCPLIDIASIEQKLAFSWKRVRPEIAGLTEQ